MKGGQFVREAVGLVTKRARKKGGGADTLFAHARLPTFFWGTWKLTGYYAVIA